MVWVIKAFDDGMLANNHEEETVGILFMYFLSHLQALPHKHLFSSGFFNQLTASYSKLSYMIL